MLLLATLLLLFATTTAARAAGSPAAVIDHFETRNDTRILHAGITIPAPASDIWQALTDYERIQKFMPDVKKSDLLAPLPTGEKRLEQHTVQGIFIFKRELRLVFRVVEEAPYRVEFSLLEGDFHTYNGIWEIDTTRTPARLKLTLQVRPSFFAPGPIIDHVVRTSGQEALEALAREALRRSRTP